MTIPGQTTKEARAQTAPDTRDWRGMIRRMAVKLTDGAVWQMLGHKLIDSRTTEVRKVDVFSGIGFASRPAPGSNADAIVVFVGGAANPVAVATRDEDLRRSMAPLDTADVTAAFNSKAVLLISGTTISARSKVGATHPLVRGDTLNTALNTLLTALNTYVLAIKAVADPGNAATPALTTAISTFQSSLTTWLTTVLKAE